MVTEPISEFEPGLNWSLVFGALVSLDLGPIRVGPKTKVLRPKYQRPKPLS